MVVYLKYLVVQLQRRTKRTSLSQAALPRNLREVVLHINRRIICNTSTKRKYYTPANRLAQTYSQEGVPANRPVRPLDGKRYIESEIYSAVVEPGNMHGVRGFSVNDMVKNVSLFIQRFCSLSKLLKALLLFDHLRLTSVTEGRWPSYSQLLTLVLLHLVAFTAAVRG